jgi:large subunit ribosomal protein L23
MELSIYEIIKGVINTPKSLELRQKFGKITFRVNDLANKAMIREAVEKIWNVKVRDVRIVRLQGKSFVSHRKTYQRPGVKKAVVTLKDGYKVDLPDQFETMGLTEKMSENVKNG